MDDNGHGTFVTGLWLQLAPSIQLSVARIRTTTTKIKNDSDAANKVVKVSNNSEF